MENQASNTLQIGISYRQILKMAVPISLAIFIPQLNFIINNIFLGHYQNDSDSLAVAGITGVYYLIFAAIGYGLNNGLQALIARKAGEDKPEGIGALFNQAIYIGLILSAIGIFATYFITPVIFKLIIHEPAIRDKAIHFLQIRIWGLPLLYTYLFRNALLVGTNQSKYLIVSTLAETIANIVFDYAFIFGHFGIPELGLNGAAFASILSEFIGLAVIFWIVRAKGIESRFQLLKNMRWDNEQNKQIMTIAYPLMFQHAISIISWQYFFLLVEHHGALSLKISNVMRNVFGIFGGTSWAFASATNAMVSNLIGQNKEDKIKILLKKILTISSSIAITYVLLLNIFPKQFLSIFGQGDEFVEAAIPTLRVVTGALFIMSFAVVFLNTVIATGKTLITFSIEAFAILFYCAYIYWALEYKNLPVHYGWMSEWIYWACLFTPSFLYVLYGKWKKTN